MAVHGNAETWQAEQQADSSSDYQHQYQDLDAAAQYNRAYQNKPTKRWSTIREIGLLARLQSGQPKCRTLLNIPSGGGRLSDTIAAGTELLIEADIAIGQLRYARQQNENKADRLWMTASGFHIPFKNNSIDGVICCRLCHHLPTATERERLLAELLRVARRYVIMTFFDYHSPKNYLRRARRPFNRKTPKLTMTRNRVAELAQRHGAELVAAPALAYPFSGHRYALMVKREPTEPVC
jgi:SAM-dependent methyltransferase